MLSFFRFLMLNIFSSLVSGNCLMIKTKTINSTQLLRLLKTRGYQNSNSLNQAHSDSGTTQIQPTVDRITLLLPFWPLSLSQKIKKSIIYFCIKNLINTIKALSQLKTGFTLITWIVTCNCIFIGVLLFKFLFCPTYNDTLV